MEVPSDALSCPITLELFRDPVVAQDGHTYERKAIEEWIKRNGTSPITSQQLSVDYLVVNYAIKKVIDQFESSLRDKKYQYTLDVDVKKKKGRPLFQTSGKTIYNAEWLPTNEGRPDVVLLKIDGARANKEASFYVDLSRHPHIVRTFGLVRDDDNDRNSIMLLQECASEGSLYELICERKKSLDEKILLQIFLQVIDAMSYLALNNVVHGDLACRNVLVFRFDEKDSRNIVVKVTDFGLSRHSQIYSEVPTVARTALNAIPIRYSAPEILSGNVTANDCTEKSDVYAMGVLMWEAYSRGAIPWADIPNDDDVVRKIRKGDILPQPANCSIQYWNIITKTWSQLPNQRPTFDQLKKLFIDQLYQTTPSTSESNMSSSTPSSSVSPSSKQNSTKLPERYRRDNQPSPSWYNLSASPEEKIGGTGVTIGLNRMDLVAQIISIGEQRCLVKGRVTCSGEELYAVESDIPKKSYTGRCPMCDMHHVAFEQPARGFYVSVQQIHEKIISDQLAKERIRGPKKPEELVRITGYFPLRTREIIGINKGIEGDSSSCYMDSTIFCMFAYSDVFDSLLNMKVQGNEPLAKLQNLLRETIVNVLRGPDGFVERDAIYNLRVLLSEATKDPSFEQVGKDPSEFLRAFEQLFRYAPLETIRPNELPNKKRSNINKQILWEMFDPNPERLLQTSIASIFRNSLLEIPVKLATIPPVLILMAPRHSRSQRSYRYIVPDRQITLDHNTVQLICINCQMTNDTSEASCDFYFCEECFLEEKDLPPTLLASTAVMCYCGGCLSKLHKCVRENGFVDHHPPKALKDVTYKLNLFAVLCIETSHYVAFVKCRTSDHQHQWLFFDSMSDRQHNAKNIPCVSRLPNFDQWIDRAENDRYFFGDLDKRVKNGRPTAQEFSEDETRCLRLFRDGAFFFYENTSADYK